MKTSVKTSGAKGATFVVLVILGRMIFLAAVSYGLIYLLWGYPLDVRRIYIGLLTATALLGGAACIIRDFCWLYDVIIWTCATACVVITAVILTLCLERSPHSLSDRELFAGAAALSFCIPAYLYLKGQNKRKKKRQLCRTSH